MEENGTEMIVKAIDVLPYYHFLRCHIEDGQPTSIEVVHITWLNDGRVCLTLDTHNVIALPPDADVEVECTGEPSSDSLQRHTQFLGKRPRTELTEQLMEIADLRAKFEASQDENEKMRKVLQEAVFEIERASEGRGHEDEWWTKWLKSAVSALPNCSVKKKAANQPN